MKEHDSVTTSFVIGVVPQRRTMCGRVMRVFTRDGHAHIDVAARERAVNLLVKDQRAADWQSPSEKGA